MKKKTFEIVTFLSLGGVRSVTRSKYSGFSLYKKRSGREEHKDKRKKRIRLFRFMNPMERRVFLHTHSKKIKQIERVTKRRPRENVF